MAQHRADGHGFSTQNGQENPTPFGMMPVTTQQILKPWHFPGSTSVLFDISGCGTQVAYIIGSGSVHVCPNGLIACELRRMESLYTDAVATRPCKQCCRKPVTLSQPWIAYRHQCVAMSSACDQTLTFL